MARFGDIDRFFRQVALSPRLIDVETLTLAAGPGDGIRFSALLHVPYRPARAALPSPPEGLRARLGEVARPVADAFVRDQALALAKSEQVATLRRTRRSPRLFLAELSAVMRDRPVVLREASVADEFVLRGLTIGEGAMRGLETRLERGFFRIGEVLMVRAGACYRFEARGRSPIAGVDADLPLPASDDLFRQDEAPCAVDRDRGSAELLRTPPPKAVRGKPPVRRGPLTLRLRDMDTADVFYVLHLLTGQAFVVDEDVRGRVSIESDGATLDDVIALIGKEGVSVSAAGPLRRVSRANGANGRVAAPAPSASPAAGSEAEAAAESTPVTFAVKRAARGEVLAVLAEAAPEAAVARAAGGRISVWAAEARLADVRAAVLEATGARGAPSGDAEPPAGETTAERRLVVRADEISVAEFQLAGVASAGEGWIAFAYAPTGVLGAYRKGDRLLDAVVGEVQSTDVLLSTEEGPLRLVLPDPGR
jgi:hypothetical protein